MVRRKIEEKKTTIIKRSSNSEKFYFYSDVIAKILFHVRKFSDEKHGGVSGAVIASELGISRAYVSKVVKKLGKLGYKFEVRKKYRLLESPDIPFPWELGRKDVILCDKVSSTQDVMKNFISSGKIDREGTWVIALSQTAGRGRMGRRWESPPGNFYGSCLLTPSLPIKEIVKVSLVGGLAVFRTIRHDFGCDVKIKWPNDVFFIADERKKISGALAEAFGEPDNVNYIILGIGVNLNSSPLDISISLRDILGKDISLIEFTSKFLDNFDSVWKDFRNGKWMTLKNEIENNMWKGKVKVIFGDGERKREIEGVCSGVAVDGSLILQLSDGRLENIYYGDVLIESNPTTRVSLHP